MDWSLVEVGTKVDSPEHGIGCIVEIKGSEFIIRFGQEIWSYYAHDLVEDNFRVLVWAKCV